MLRRHLFILVALAVAFTATAAPAMAEDDPVRAIFGRDDSPNGTDKLVAAGFNAVPGIPDQADLDDLHSRGLQAIIWLGEYNRNEFGLEDEASKCRFLFDDAWIIEQVTPVAGHPAIAAYQIADEPSYARRDGCDIAADLKGRSDLLKSIDPSKPTYVTVPTNDGLVGYPYEFVVGTADIYGLVAYPCSFEWDAAGGCRYDIIENSIIAAEAAGIDRYWGVVQGFGDGWYRAPTFDEFKYQYDLWDNSNAEGTVVLWWDGIEPLGLDKLHALNTDFVDVPRDNIHYSAVEWLASSAITQGCNPPLNDRFCPGAHLTRGQMAAFLARALALPITAADAFVDDDQSIFQSEINAIAAGGFTQGCNPPAGSKFCPNDLVTRGQMAAFLARGLDLPAADVDFFSDDDSSIFEAEINRLAAARITLGCNEAGTLFCPDSLVTRSQMAAFLFRAVTNYGR